MKDIKILPLILCLVVCASAGAIGSLFTFEAIPTWYASLNKPAFNPPNWVFGPVWTTLYFMMGISLYLIWTKKSKKAEKKTGLYYFSAQLLLNAAWSIVFFGFKSPILAFVVIAVLWFSIFQTIRYFQKLSKNAAYLLYPYLAWVSFASILNLAIVILN